MQFTWNQQNEKNTVPSNGQLTKWKIPQNLSQNVRSFGSLPKTWLEYIQTNFSSCIQFQEKQETTGQSPFFLMFERESKLPVNIIFKNTDQDQPENLQKYILI